MALRMVKNGGAAMDAQDDPILLHAAANTNGYYSWFVKAGSSNAGSAYQVTAGKSFYVTEVRAGFYGGVSVNLGMSILSADNAVAGYSQASFSPTSAVQIFGGHSWSGFAWSTSTTTIPALWQGCFKAALATKYPYVVFSMSAGAAVNVLMMGYEA